MKPAPGPSPNPAPSEPARVRANTSLPRVLPVGRLGLAGRWRIEGIRALDESCLIWITRGQGRITLDAVTRGYSAHNAILIPAGTIHALEIGPQSLGWAVFFGTRATQPLPETPLHLRIREPSANTDLSVLIEALQREIDSPRPASDRAAQMLVGLIGVWLERQSLLHPNEVHPDGAARQLAARFAALLEDNFRSGMGVGDYADKLGVTATHLTRVCRATCGRAASDLLQDRRLYEARRLLADTAVPIKDIAEQLGFTNPTYFSRAFHARTGKTPSQFRKPEPFQK